MASTGSARRSPASPTSWWTAIERLQHAQHEAHEAGSVEEEARVFVETVIPAQNELREVADELETLVADDLWPLPKYRELLFQY